MVLCIPEYLAKIKPIKRFKRIKWIYKMYLFYCIFYPLFIRDNKE